MDNNDGNGCFCTHNDRKHLMTQKSEKLDFKMNTLIAYCTAAECLRR